MIYFNGKIKTLNEVKEIYSHIKDIENLLKLKIVKKLINEEYFELFDEEKFYEGKVTAERNTQLKEIVEARGLYRFLWGVDHINDQLLEAGWNTKNIVTVIKRMRRAGFDPYSTTEDTVAQFINSLNGNGFVEKTIKGKTLRVYSPHGNE